MSCTALGLCTVFLVLALGFVSFRGKNTPWKEGENTPWEEGENTPWKEPSAAECSSQHPESERAKEIMNKILVFSFMWNRAAFQDFNRKSYNLQENIQ